jgi:hypothetical protein
MAGFYETGPGSAKSRTRLLFPLVKQRYYFMTMNGSPLVAAPADETLPGGTNHDCQDADLYAR